MSNEYSDVPASQVSLDVHSSIRKLIEEINFKIYELANMIAISGEPVGANLLGVNKETLEAFGNMPRSKVMAILTTGVPICELRFKSPDIIEELSKANGFNSDKLFSLMLKTFDPLPPLKRV